ncbi:MAG: NUDIX domain-containing protein [Fidelibacterota bacterium]
MAREIERKFLVKQMPDRLNAYEKILQGYLSIESKDIEVRFRKKGKQYYQTIKRGTGLNREEIEIELTKEQFVMLWPLTREHRIVKRRYHIPYNRYIIELDIYADRYNGLVAAEVEFPSEQEAKEFCPPDWFGAEITEEVALQNNHLALNGIDDKLLQKYHIDLQTKNIYRQSGAVPVRKHKGVTKALIIRSNNKKKWIFPKGIVEHGLTAEESAQKEAYEEAGVLGTIGKKIGEYEYHKWNGTCHVELFIMNDAKELKRWPEDFRKRKWVPITALDKYIKKEELKSIIDKLNLNYS